MLCDYTIYHTTIWHFLFTEEKKIDVDEAEFKKKWFGLCCHHEIVPDGKISV
jgi:hypothetical protein